MLLNGGKRRGGKEPQEELLGWGREIQRRQGQAREVLPRQEALLPGDGAAGEPAFLCCGLLLPLGIRATYRRQVDQPFHGLPYSEGARGAFEAHLQGRWTRVLEGHAVQRARRPQDLRVPISRRCSCVSVDKYILALKLNFNFNYKRRVSVPFYHNLDTILGHFAFKLKPVDW